MKTYCVTLFTKAGDFTAKVEAADETAAKQEARRVLHNGVHDEVETPEVTEIVGVEELAEVLVNGGTDAPKIEPNVCDNCGLVNEPGATICSGCDQSWGMNR